MAEVRVRASLALGYQAPDEPRSLRATLKALCPQAPRRLNRFTELALTGALGCVQRAGIALPPECGLYLATGHGYAEDTARLVGAMVLSGQAPMPVDFINVSGSSAGFYLAQVLGLRGRNCAIASGTASFEAALELAWSALAVEPGLALVGGVDDPAYPLAEHRIRLGLQPDLAVAEISSWLLLDSRAGAPGIELAEPRFFDDFKELADTVASSRAAPMSLGGGLAASERGELIRLAAGRCLRAFEYGYADTAGAYAVASFTSEQAMQPLLHASGDGVGGYYLLELGQSTVL